MKSILIGSILALSLAGAGVGGAAQMAQNGATQMTQSRTTQNAPSGAAQIAPNGATQISPGNNQRGLSAVCAPRAVWTNAEAAACIGGSYREGVREGMW